MEYLSVTEFCQKYDLDVRNVRRYISQGRIPGQKIGNQWVIPADATPPEDKRIKSGKYVKHKDA